MYVNEKNYKTNYSLYLIQYEKFKVRYKMDINVNLNLP